jgi:3-oxoacyl-[acyl-carrier-protein] synthase III
MGWQLDDFDHLIMHQISSQTIKMVKSKLNEISGRTLFDDNNTINNLAYRGNTSSTTHIVAIMDHILSGRIKSGDKILFSINASGITVGTAVYVMDDLPDRIRQGVGNQDMVGVEELG